MARKFGNRKKISQNINDFMIGIMGPSGWGKTTLMYETCEKLFGPDGYVIADMDSNALLSLIAGDECSFSGYRVKVIQEGKIITLIIE